MAEQGEIVDVAVVGAGAAGLFAAVWAGRAAGGRARIVALDGARKLGAKILVAGGGRCNVTHDVVDESAYAGSSRNGVKKVLRRYGVEETVAFFRELGVELKREETGKLFPVTDDAQTVLDAMLRAARGAGVELRNPWRVGAVRREGEGFLLEEAGGMEGAGGDTGRDARATVRARRVVLATGGLSLPRSGSDGYGHHLAKRLGHSITTRVFPALVPLTLPKEHFVCGLSGLAVPASLEVRAGSGKRLARFTDSTLCTHFGLSGPCVLDISRYYLDAAANNPGAALVINWLPDQTSERLDAALLDLGKQSAGRFLRDRLPDRLADALCAQAGVDPAAPGHAIVRERRLALVRAVTEMPLPVTGNRGWNYAEVTAGGVPLSEIHLDTMESRVCPGLHLCGEICDVDGRIGGYNFQWAWASGYVAGLSAGREISHG